MKHKKAPAKNLGFFYLFYVLMRLFCLYFAKNLKMGSFGNFAYLKVSFQMGISPELKSMSSICGAVMCWPQRVDCSR